VSRNVTYINTVFTITIPSKVEKFMIPSFVVKRDLNLLGTTTNVK